MRMPTLYNVTVNRSFNLEGIPTAIAADDDVAGSCASGTALSDTHVHLWPLVL